MANKPDHKQTDYGYFGKGIDGYVHYTQAFNRNFPKDGQDELYSEMMRPKANPPKILPASSDEENSLNNLKVFGLMLGIPFAIALIIIAIAGLVVLIALGLDWYRHWLDTGATIPWPFKL